MKLDRQEAFDVAHKLIMYFNDFKRIDDYFRARKIERVKNLPVPLPGFGLEDDMFQNYDMHPEDMNFKVAVIPTKTFDAMLEKTASFSPDENPGKTHKMVVYETTTLNASLSVSPNGPWDFSNLNPVDQSDIAMQPIENSSYSITEYPNTTHIKSFMSGDQSVIQFPGFTESGYSYNGENSIIVNNYASPLILHPYPFTVGDSHSDEVTNIPFTCAICPPEMYRDHSVTSEAIGSGSVTMPDGTIYENVVLIQHVAIFTDAQTGSSPCVTTRESYFFWAEDLGIPIVETYNQISEGACSFGSVQFSRFYTGQSELVTSCPDEYELPILWRDNFECHSPFAIDNIEGWTIIDGDGGQTWGATNVDFGNENFVGS